MTTAGCSASWRIALRAMRAFGTIIAVAAIAWSAGLCAYALSVPRAPADSSIRTDAIVVPTGGAGRLEAGVTLLADGLAEKLFVTGVSEGLEVADVFTEFVLSPDTAALIACCVELGHGAEDTAGNAAEAALWMDENGYSSLRLVTGSYHMTRSMMEFHQAMPDANLVANPIFSPHVKVDDWWRYKGTAGLIASEYTKYLAALVRAAIGTRHIPSIRS